MGCRTGYIASAAYAQSKLAQLLSTVHMSRMFTENQIPVNVFAVHPGIVNTELFDGTAIKTIFPWVPRLLFKVCFSYSNFIVKNSFCYKRWFLILKLLNFEIPVVVVMSLTPNKFFAVP